MKRDEGQDRTEVLDPLTIVRSDHGCFGCGDANPIGLHLHFTRTTTGVVAQFTPGIVHQGFDGIVHGGIIATVADETAWHAIIHCLGGPRKVTTTELKVNYLRPFAGKALTARATVLKLGRMLCVSRVDMFNEHKKLAAHATVTYAILE